MTIFSNVLRFGRRRLHTIISSEIIKPSSPTPSHLKTYNFTVLDQTLGSNTMVPFVAFYTNDKNYPSSRDKTLDLKNSLSKTLTKYYPFAGRFTRTGAAHVDCNDEGAEFIVASNDATLSDFLQNSKHEDLDQFFPYDRIWYNSNRESEGSQVIVPVTVQINHFKCGGVAVAASVVHKVADGASVVHFLNDWAKMTRFDSTNRDQANQANQSLSDPQFVSFPYRNIHFDSFTMDGTQEIVTRSFVFPNSKINELKLKLKFEENENPSRVEALTWLLYKCMVEAGNKNNSGIFRPTTYLSAINVRRRMIEPLPEKSIGNYFMLMEIPTKEKSEMNPQLFLSELKKQKLKFQGVRNIEAAFDLLPNTVSETALEEHQKKLEGSYVFSSLCRNPVYEIDFGWGKPVKVSIPGNVRNLIILIDGPKGDGIEVLVCLDREEMEVFQSDPELLAYC